MKLLSFFATKLLIGMALSVSGLVAPALAAEDPAPAVDPDSAVTAQKEPAASAAALQDPAATDAAEGEEIDLAALQRAGYKIINENGVDLFCKTDEVLGSRLRKKTRCLTAAQMEQERTAASNAISDLSRKAPNTVGD